MTREHREQWQGWRGPKPAIVPLDAVDPLGLPPVRWWFLPPAHSPAHRTLRGGAAFDLARDCGIDVQEPAEQGAKFTSRGFRHRIFVVNAMTPAMVTAMRGMRQWRRPPKIVVDVTVPIDNPGAVYSPNLPDPGDPLFEHEAELARDALRAHMEHLVKAIKLADAVTTPWPDWASPLTLLNDHVEVLPDLNDEADAPAFLATVARLFGDEELIR